MTAGVESAYRLCRSGLQSVLRDPARHIVQVRAPARLLVRIASGSAWKSGNLHGDQRPAPLSQILGLVENGSIRDHLTHRS